MTGKQLPELMKLPLARGSGEGKTSGTTSAIPEDACGSTIR